jgi:hypothetical protein
MDGAVNRLYSSMPEPADLRIFRGKKPPELPLGPIEMTGSGGGTSSHETVTLPVESRGTLEKTS